MDHIRWGDAQPSGDRGWLGDAGCGYDGRGWIGRPELDGSQHSGHLHSYGERPGDRWAGHVYGDCAHSATTALQFHQPRPDGAPHAQHADRRDHPDGVVGTVVVAWSSSAAQKITVSAAWRCYRDRGRREHPGGDSSFITTVLSTGGAGPCSRTHSPSTSSHGRLR